MCVIALVQTEEQRLTSEQIVKMHTNNSSGAGIVWLTPETPGGPLANVLNWRKALKVEDVQKVLPTLPLPYAVHFRNPSPNTPTGALMCHPFIVDEDATCDLAGSRVGGASIMHNGYWGQWRDKTMDIALIGHHRIPSGQWTDSRAIAFAAHVLGAGVLEFINEKVLFFSTDVIQTYGSGWSTLPNGLLVSNLAWQSVSTTVTPPTVGHSHIRGSGYLAELDRQAAAQGTGTVIGGTGGAPHHGSFRSPVTQEERAAGEGAARALGFAPNASRTDGTLAQRRTVQETIRQESETVSSRPTRGREGLSTWARRVQNGTDCQDCGTAAGEIQNHGVRRCWPCWDAFQRSVPSSGICDTCRTAPTTAIVLDTGDWVCDPCWRRMADQPAIVRHQDLTGQQRKALQARQAGGSV